MTGHDIFDSLIKRGGGIAISFAGHETNYVVYAPKAKTAAPG